MKHTFEYKGYTIEVEVRHDEDSGPPWKECDGHGGVTGWEHRDKRPGELILNSDRGSKRFYDYAGAIKIAKRDGWGLGDKAKSELAARLGRPPTAGEIIAKAVENDFEYLRGWCNDEWCYQGYTTEITKPDGSKVDGDSCWGYDDEEYMLKEAKENAESTVDRLETIRIEMEIAERIP